MSIGTSEISAERRYMPSSQRLIDLVTMHTQAEVAGDLDAVLATLCPQPHYEIHPLGISIDDMEAVREYYKLNLQGLGSITPVGESGTFGDGYSGRHFGENGIVTWDCGLLPQTDGPDVLIKCLAIFEFDPASNLLKGEKIFLNRVGAQAFEASLGPDFLSLPGVSVEGERR